MDDDGGGGGGELLVVDEYALLGGGGCRPFASPTPCAHSRLNERCEVGKIDYLAFYFCDDDDANIIFGVPARMKIPVLAAWAGVLFSAIAIVADVFFAPAIRTISKMFKLPDDVAGATLLALGGSAPDIFTQLAAMCISEKPDFNLAMSESVGAGIYVCSICKALAVVFSPGRAGVTVEAVPYLRDCMHFCALLLISYAMCSYGQISFAFGFMYLSVYAFYVCFVIYGRHWVDDWIPVNWKGVGGSHDSHSSGKHSSGGGGMKTVKSHVLEDASDEEDNNIEMTHGVVGHHGEGSDDDHADLHGMYEITDDEDSDDECVHSPASSPRGVGVATATTNKNLHNLHKKFVQGSYRGSDDSGADKRVGAAIRSRRHSDDFSLGQYFSSLVSSFRRWLSMQSGAKKWSDDPTTWLTGWIVVLVSLTMPSTSRGRVRPLHAAVIAFIAPLFLLYATGMLEIVLFGFDGTARSLLEKKLKKGVTARGHHGELQFSAYVIFAICAFWAKLAHSKTPSRGTDPKTSPIMLFCAFVVGIAWMHILADEIVFMFQAFGHIFGIRESLLGGTLMAWGASAGDLAGMLAVARMGHAKMAVTASLASPGTQLAVGSGISILIVRLRDISVPINFTKPMKMLMQYGIAVTAYYVFLVPFVHKFSFKKAQAASIAITYAVFVIAFVIVATRGGA